MASFNSTVIARVAAALYDLQLGNETMDWALEQVNATPGGIGAVVQSLVNADFAGQTNAQIASKIVANVGITGAVAPVAEQAVVDALVAYGPGNQGAAIVQILNTFASLTSHPDPTIAAAATAFNKQIMAAVVYADGSDTVDVPVHPERFPVVITAGTAAGGDVMRLTGNQDIRIDFTNPANQVVGLDLDYDGTIEFDGKERSITGRAADFEIVDAYPRNPLDQTDSANNFLGDIEFDGEGFEGDGVSTNGNIVLGGLGTDRILGGNGNDFLAGGGIAQGRVGSDTLFGGRNADFFFAQFAGIDLTDGNISLRIDGGNTADDSAAGTHTGQDADWLLFESSDDEEPVVITLGEDDAPFDIPTEVNSRTGESMHVEDVENFDASGNLYGFLNDMDVQIGDRAIDDRDADNATVGYNYSYGSSAQLRVTGSAVDNIIVGGYDNDRLDGAGGNDLLMGGNLNFLNNPNLSKIVNNGRDELIGGAGNDNIVFEADGGIIEGGADSDTLWLTRESLGTGTTESLTKDGVLRFDLKSENIDTANGYGGANSGTFNNKTDDTQDQTNYKSGATRVKMTGMESVIATGLGGVDYVAAGTNNPELTFTNQQNHFRYDGNLDLRGTDGDIGILQVAINGELQEGAADNTLYASSGADVLEGRGGDDRLSGGNGNDDFYFGTSDAGTAIGDNVDVIHRQTDANNDNLWDGFDPTVGGVGLFERDFNIGGTSTTGASVLKIAIQKAGGNTAGTQLNQVVNNVSEIVTGVKDGATFTAITLNTAEIKAATTYQGLTDAINAALDATAFGADLQATLQSDGFTIFISDSKGRDLADSSTEVPGAGVSVNQIANTATQNTFEYGAPAVAVTKDRLIYKSYEDRADNEGTDDDGGTGSIITLGIDSYAEDLVINFADEDGDGAATTRIAEDQAYNLTFRNITTQDRVTVTVNGVNYSLQVGVDLDGNIIAGEDGVGDTQTEIQDAFIDRLVAFINSFMDDDTAAGKVSAAKIDGDSTTTTHTIQLTQTDYSGEETVFMTMPTVTLTNQSGGEAADVEVVNVSQHEVELLDFDGRNGELNDTNVLFWGAEAVQRAELSTAKNTGDTLTGYEAMVIDVGANNLQDVVFGTTMAIPNNTATNAPLSGIPNGWSVHGDDFLIGGAGLDTISGGTGDDRVEGSVGGNGTTTWDTIDGGKNFYAVQVLGEAQARVYVLNKWEAANPSRVAALQNLVISSITLIDQNESGTGVSSGVFDDTLQFTQKLFTPGVTRFTVTLDNFVLTGGVVELQQDGAGTVGVDVDGNGTIDNWTRFTNFENIRTVSGTGNAVAGDGQGNDTLNVSALSSATTGANGIMYNLTNNVVGGFAAGSVTYSANAHASLTKPAIADFESLVLRVDGVESVIGGTGDDLLVIDETEAAKNNTFTGDLGDDRIIYQNDFGTIVGEPSITIKVDNVAAALGGTDTVTSTAGRVGSVQAVDTLNGVEYISLENNTAASVRENDVLDVSAITGATVSYVDGTVKAGGVTHVTIDGIVQIERVNAGAGNDTVIVADSAVMTTNLRDDFSDATPNTNILFMTYLDFDDQASVTSEARKSFGAQVADDTITNVINQGEFTFALSDSGAGTETADRVDYSAELGRIIVPVGQGSATNPQYVVVDGDNDLTLTDDESRVDVLRSVEEIVAAQGDSVMDFTGVGAARQITFQYTAPSGNPADGQLIEQTIRIADASGNTVAGLNGFVEKYKYNTAVNPNDDATWNQIEGGDFAETVIFQGSEDLVNQAGLDHRYQRDFLNLRGGANEVRYSPLETSITAQITVVEESTTTVDMTDGRITAQIFFQDGLGVNAPSGVFLGGQHTITSNTSDNSTAAGSLKLEGSQDAEDVVEFQGLGAKTFILGSSPGVITVNIGTATSMTLTGFEFIQDAASNDVYNFSSLVGVTGLTLIDNGADHDVIKVGNDAAAATFNGGIAGNTTISLAALNTFFTYDFDVLDVSGVSLATLTTLIGGGGADDELVLGALGTAATTTVTDFDALVITDATINAHGTSFVFNSATDALVIGAKTVQLDADFENIISFAGTAYDVTPVPHATKAISFTMTGNEAVTVWGSDAADTITTNGGNDTLRGGMGADTLSGGTQAAVGASLNINIGGVGTTSGAAASTLTLAGLTLTTAAVPAGELQIAPNADADQVGNAFASVSLATWRTALDNAGLSLDEANALTSVTYNGVTNNLVFSFNTSNPGGVDILDTDLEAANTPAVTGTAVLNSTEDGTSYAAPVDSADTFVFEATGALNGADTLNQVDASDTFDFDAFTGGGTDTETFVYSSGGTFSPAAGTELVAVANKSSLAASDFAAAATAGKFNIADGDTAVFAVTADATGAAGTAGNQPWLLYYVSNGATAGTGDLTVTLVGTVNSTVELTAADITGML
jgi:hypothetical protein